MNLKKGVTLVSLVVTIIVLLIIAGAIVAVSLNTGFLNLTKGSKDDFTIAEIKEYASSVKASIVDDDLNKYNLLDKFIGQVETDNSGKEEVERHKVIVRDDSNTSVTLRRNNVDVIISLKDLEKDFDDIKNISQPELEKRYTVSFLYKDEDEEMTKKIIVPSNTSIQQYLDDNNDSIPTDKEWKPNLELEALVLNNIEYREYIAKTGTVLASFNLAGGKLNGKTSIESIEYTVGDTVADVGEPLKEHYTFGGWNPSLGETINENTTFSAQWGAVNYIYTFKLNGGNIGGSVSDKTTSGTYDTNTTTPIDPIREHHTFTGWSPNVPSKYDANRTFTAQWSPINYTYTFKLNGGNIDGSTEDKKTSGTYTTDTILPTNPTRDHYTFAGWSPSVPNKYDGNKTFTAQWTPVNYTYTFKLNGGNIGGSTADKVLNGTYETNLVIPANPTREHYIFAGWSPSVPDKFNGNKTFTAQWTPVNYTITYNLNGGTYEGSTNNQTRLVPYNTSPPDLTPTRSEYVFLGWTPTLSVVVGNQTYTALWSIPMEIQMKKASLNEKVLIPIEMPAGNFTLISNNNGEFTKYTANNPLLTNNVSANTVFTVKIAGRINQLNYDKKTTAQKKQMHKIVDWGVLYPTSYESAFIGCENLTGPLPTPRTNSFVDVTSFESTFNDCSNLTGNIPTGFFNNCPGVTTFASTFNGCSKLSGNIPSGLFNNCPNVTSFASTFSSCSSLQGNIPSGLFNNCPNVTSFASTFYTCKGLTGSIPSGLFNNCKKVTTFRSTFNKCSNITEIPGGLFANCSKVETFQFTFFECHNLTESLPADLFTGCNSVTNFYATFYDCNSLGGSIPTGLFNSCTEVTTFQDVFYNCYTLTGSIPPNLFTNCTKVENMQSVFSNAAGLTGTIPPALFSTCTEVTTYASIFNNCSSLQGSIPSGLFSNSPNVTTFDSSFEKCRTLTGTIPSGLFNNASNVTTFHEAFMDCENITGIQSGLFDNCPNVTTFYNTFLGCVSLQGDIPSGLFDNCPNVENFGRTFYNCKALTGIPSGLFDKCTKVISFDGTFSQCENLKGSIPSGLFDKCQSVTNFYNTFNGCVSLTGSAPNLWNRTGIEYKEGCFRNCSKLSNYASIPAAWK